MKILKPSWINHSGFSIFSVDVHPDGTRLASGGADNKAKIWSIAPISVAEVEEDTNVPKLLKSCEGHYAPVNSVKWSKDGKYLATGSDDKLVIIWGLSSSSLDFSFDSNPTVENWVCVHTLRGHSADISEVAWSPDSRFLASCSFDKSIIIWETNKFQMVRKLEEHTGMVKGISWDPIGKYLASQSDDKSVIIWRVSDWLIETKITEPYQHNEQSFFTRLSWAPDGQFLCSPHAISDQTHVAVIIQRSNWERGYLVGHKKATVVVRYSPVIYKEKQLKVCCMLVGGKDSTLSLWSSQNPRALMITTQFFTQSIQDISWCPDGLSFVVCSTDGSIGYISLEPNEMGQPISTSEKAVLFKSIYGDAVKVSKDGSLIFANQSSSGSAMGMEMNGSGNHSMFVENPDQLELEESEKSTTRRDLLKSSSSSNGSSSNITPIKIQPTQLALQNQKQIVTPTGKRRITPLHIGGTSTQSLTTPSPISIPIHLQHDSPHKSNGTTDNSTALNLDINSNNNNKIGLHVDDASTSNHDISMKDKTPTKDQQIPTSTSPNSNLTNIISNKRKSPLDSNVNTTTNNSSTGINLENNVNSQKKIKTKRKDDVSTNKQQQQLIQQPQNIQFQANNGNNNNNNGTITNSNIYIPPPIPVNQRSKQLTSNLYDYYSNSNNNGIKTNGFQQQQNIILDINVNEQELYDNSIEFFTVLKCFTDSTLTWENKIAGRVSLATGNRNWSAIATTDSTIHIYNKNGSIIMSNIVLRNPISFLESNNRSHLLAITCDGYVSVWNVLKKKSEMSNRELPFIMNKEKLTIKYTHITEDSGKPIITFSNGDSFVYSLDIGEWIKISDRLGSLSEFNSNDTNATGILSRLQSQSNNSSPLTVSNLLSLSDKQIQQEPPHQQQNLTTTFLEKQLWLATVLESSLEYKHWLRLYITHLTKFGNLTKLQDICSDLLGPSSNLVPGDQSIWESNILTFDKRSLLHEFLPIIGRNRSLQRFYIQYKESLTSFNKHFENLGDPF